MGKLALATLGGLGTLALLGGEEEQKKTASTMRDLIQKEHRLGIGLVDNKKYNLNNKEERDQYFKDLRKKQGIDEDEEDNVGRWSRRGQIYQEQVRVILFQKDYPMVSLS